jgi:crotonobetaine/carnitine-CoA ligase
MEGNTMVSMPDRSEAVFRYIMERNARERRDKVCLVFEDQKSWTYGEALLEGYKAASALSGLGVKQGENVLIFLDNGPDSLRAWWGVTFSGATMVPVNTAYKGEMLRHVLRDSSARIIIASSGHSAMIHALEPGLQIVDPSVIEKGEGIEPRLDRPIEPWDIHAIIYTSGTTGLSKGVMIPYLQNYVSAGVWTSMATDRDTFLVDAAIYHMLGINPFFAMFHVGGRVALRRVFSGSCYWEVVRECGVTFSVLIGTMAAFLESVPPKPDDADNPLRVVSPAPMVKDPDAFMSRFGIEVLTTGFGMTELSNPIFFAGRVTDIRRCGKLREGFEARLVDEHDIPVPAGQSGELVLRTDLPWAINAGYWRRPEETAEAWRNGWFHTGDLFTRDNEGNFYFVDRRKDTIRRRGENISSFEVEREVLRHPEIAEAACVAVPGEFGGEDVKVFVRPKEMERFHPADLIGFLLPKMPHFMVPRYVEVIPEFPKTATHRIKKHELRLQGNGPATWDRETAGMKVTRSS